MTEVTREAKIGPNVEPDVQESADAASSNPVMMSTRELRRRKAPVKSTTLKLRGFLGRSSP
jgi:hypothetical protein